MITAADIQYIASLARIHLQTHEINAFTKDLEEILHYIEQLNKLDVTKVEPTSHVLSLQNVFRQDVIQPSLTQEEALAIAPVKAQGAFKVPQIIE